MLSRNTKEALCPFWAAWGITAAHTPFAPFKTLSTLAASWVLQLPPCAWRGCRSLCSWHILDPPRSRWPTRARKASLCFQVLNALASASCFVASMAPSACKPRYSMRSTKFSDISPCPPRLLTLSSDRQALSLEQPIRVKMPSSSSTASSTDPTKSALAKRTLACGQVAVILLSRGTKVARVGPTLTSRGTRPRLSAAFSVRSKNAFGILNCSASTASHRIEDGRPRIASLLQGDSAQLVNGDWTRPNESSSATTCLAGIRVW